MCVTSSRWASEVRCGDDALCSSTVVSSLLVQIWSGHFPPFQSAVDWCIFWYCLIRGCWVVPPHPAPKANRRCSAAAPAPTPSCGIAHKTNLLFLCLPGTAALIQGHTCNKNKKINKKRELTRDYHWRLLNSRYLEGGACNSYICGYAGSKILVRSHTPPGGVV